MASTVPAGGAAVTRRARLRLGILGTARIAREFVAGAAGSDEVEVVAVASRDRARAVAFGQATGVALALGSYEALLADPAVDAVYVPLPNSLHAEWVIRALSAGKHVLCEKPLATRTSDVAAMFAAARAHGRVLVEGFPYRSQPQTQTLRALIEAGEIGEPRFMQASFGFLLADAANIRLDPALGGGATFDVGTYPVSLVRLVAGERPRRVRAVAHWRDSGVDDMLAATLEHAGGFVAQVGCSFSFAAYRHAVIAGSGGVLKTDFLNNPPAERPAVVWLKRGAGWNPAYEAIETPVLNGFRAEVDAFARRVRGQPGDWNGATEAESLDIMMTLEALLESARRGQPVDLPG